ncbi:type II toxin-antitoxin system Phd/YefM family antitoxin [Candidatus Gracilibacteria bacterium]|nr:type II toxin-antitoxin system Phd/YefM family antitoxin [Candidatus Gracilibacteria bacterium]
MWELQTATATEAKTHFGRFIDKSQKNPILIQKNKKDYSVLLSIDDFEDLLLTIKSYEAIEGGFVGADESEAFLKELIQG